MNISCLADADLAEIFERLPPYERLIVSEVCRRWRDSCPSTWVDVRDIDLGPIPSKNIGAIITRRPNLQSVIAAKKSFSAKSLYSLCKAPLLASVKLYDCKFEIDWTPDINTGEYDVYLLRNVFSQHVEHVAWRELVLQRVCVVDTLVVQEEAIKPKWKLSPLPVSLCHLQLGPLRADSGAGFYLYRLQQLQNLECLVLQQPDNEEDVGFECCFCLDRIGNLKKLKELSFSPVASLSSPTQLSNFVASMPHLEVLFLQEVRRYAAGDIAAVITGPSALRILVLSGEFHSHAITRVPARPRFPHGTAAPPLPQLHVFVGRQASERLSFEQPAPGSDNSISAYPIDQPMPDFLDRADIAPIFEGVWVAEQIKATFNCGGRLWDYNTHDTAVSVQRYTVDEE